MINITNIFCADEDFGNCAMRLVIEFDNAVTEHHNSSDDSRVRHNSIRLYLEELDCRELLSAIADQMGDMAFMYSVAGVAYGRGVRILSVLCDLANGDKEVLGMVENAMGYDLTAKEVMNAVKTVIPRFM